MIILGPEQLETPEIGFLKLKPILKGYVIQNSVNFGKFLEQNQKFLYQNRPEDIFYLPEPDRTEPEKKTQNPNRVRKNRPDRALNFLY